MNSSVWLARDRQDQRYLAIKSIKGYSTRLINKGYMQELEVLKRISSEQINSDACSTHCTSLLSHFTHQGEDGDGNHLCLVTDVSAGDVRSLRNRFPKGVLPLPLTKRILRHTLLGIAHIHKCGVVHTDIKADNIMMDKGRVSDEEMDAIIRDEPPRRHPPEASWEKQVEVAISQPLLIPSPGETMEELASRSFLLSDFGSAQFIDRQVVDYITPSTLRAPETIIKGPWDEKVDIWIFGCLVFEFVTGVDFFTRKSPNSQPDETHLLQMMCVTGERFMPDQLQRSRAALELFDPNTCLLRAWPYLTSISYQKMMATYDTLSQDDMDAAASLMKKCLRLDPRNRASAAELLNDPWFMQQ